MARWHAARLVAREQVSPALFTLALEVPAEVRAAHVLPGQYHQLSIVEGDAHFAIASAPGAPRFEYLIHARGQPGHGLDALPVGASLQVSLPEGPGFPLPRVGAAPLLLVATGSAIAPVRSVIQGLARLSVRPQRVTVLWGLRHERTLPFEAEHAAWKALGVDLHPIISSAAPTWTGLRGHVQDRLSHHTHTGTFAFICGQPDMEAQVSQRLVELGVPRSHIALNHL